MLNYIRAEFYKLLHRKYTYIALGGLLACEALLVAGYAFHNSHSFATPFGDAVVVIAAFGAIGFCVSLFTGDIVFAGQYKNNTLKNEVSFGLSRAQIYMGKLLAQTILSILYLVVMMGFYIGLCAMILPHNLPNSFGDREGLVIVGYFLAVGLPIWIGAQAACCMCLFLIGGDMAASIVYMGIIFGLGTVVELMGYLIPGGAGEALLKAHEHFPGPMLDAAGTVVGDWAFLGKAWIVGVFWLVVSTVIGLYGFQRKEIK